MMDLSFWLSFCVFIFIPEPFQSLLWWICLFDIAFWIKQSRPGMFQSLLWWICLFDSFIPNRNGSGDTVSILVMMDLSFWLAISLAVSNSFFEFQSLLWWICLFDWSCDFFMNPPFRFQSLLWWICLFDPITNLMLQAGILVSILVMMDLSFWQGSQIW